MCLNGVEFSVTKIGNLAFAENSNIKNVTLSEGLLSIERYAFASTSLNSLTIPSTVNNIDYMPSFSLLNLDKKLSSNNLTIFFWCEGWDLLRPKATASGKADYHAGP